MRFIASVELMQNAKLDRGSRINHKPCLAQLRAYRINSTSTLHIVIKHEYQDKSIQKTAIYDLLVSFI